MRFAILTLILHCLATCLLESQERLPPPPPISGETRKLSSARNPSGVKQAKPVVPAVEELLENSKKGKVDADSMWIVIERAKNRGMTAIDVSSDGNCWVMERKPLGKEKTTSYLMRFGKTVPIEISERILSLARQKSVLFRSGASRISGISGAERLRIGVSSKLGRSVHTSPSMPFDQYPDDFREAALALLQASRQLPLDETALGVVSAEFVDPRQARRLTLLSGKKLIGVKDPGKDAKRLSAAVAAARMPGRRIVVSEDSDWERIKTYLNFAAPDNVIEEGKCLISVGSQTFWLMVEGVIR